MSTTIDMRGKTITTYILYNAAMALDSTKNGKIVEIVTDPFDPIENDICAWCRMNGHQLTDVQKFSETYHFHIVKGIPLENKRKLAMIISEAGLEELLSPLGFALGAALEGIEVSIYFQGPAVRVLKTGFKEHLTGFNRLFTRFARNGLTAVGHLPAQEKVQQLHALGAHLYVCGPSMQHFGVKESDLIFGDLIICEYFTFMEVINQADIHFMLQ